MKDLFTIPNFISLFRVLLMFYGFWQFSLDQNKIFFLFLTIIVVSLDGLDGVIARKLNQATPLGAKIDILADRLTELSYWYFFAHLKLIGVWVFWFFLLRGIIVDYLSRKKDKPLGDSWLRSSRFMRASYGVLKLLSFMLLIISPHLVISGVNLTNITVYLTVLICFLRAWPVLRAIKRIH